jgi:hypothetical protein
MSEGTENALESSRPTDGNERAQKLSEELKAIQAENNAMEGVTGNFSVDVAASVANRPDGQEEGRMPVLNEAKDKDLETTNLEAHPETEEFLGWLQQRGVTISNPDTARQALNDPDLFNQPLPPLLGKLGMTMEDARAIGMDLKKEITKVTAARFREYIANTDWERRLSRENLDIVVNSEDTPRSAEDVSVAVSQILESDNLEFAQGAVWAMASAPDSPWVAKFVKSREPDPGERSASPEWTMNEMLEQRSDVAEVFGEDLLLDQVALLLKDKKTPLLLQEKVNMAEWTPMGAFNSEVLADVQEAINGHTENARVLNVFLDGLQRLEASKGLVLDFSGDNVVFKTDEQGKLIIKIIDYGCTKLEGEEPQRLAHLHGHAAQLRSLVAS